MGEYSLDKYYKNSSFLMDKNKQVLYDFNSYIAKNKISINDNEKIEKWIRDYKYIDMYIFNNNKLVYNSNRYTSYFSFDDLEEMPNISSKMNNVSFADADVKVFIDSYFEKYLHKYNFIRCNFIIVNHLSHI